MMFLITIKCEKISKNYQIPQKIIKFSSSINNDDDGNNDNSNDNNNNNNNNNNDDNDSRNDSDDDNNNNNNNDNNNNVNNNNNSSNNNSNNNNDDNNNNTNNADRIKKLTINQHRSYVNKQRQIIDDHIINHDLIKNCENQTTFTFYKIKQLF